MEQYYTVYVYKHSGMGCEKVCTNVLAVSEQQAMERVAGSYSWLRSNPMYAFVQPGRV